MTAPEVRVIRAGDGVAVASVRGEIDLASATDVERALVKAFDDAGALIVDLTATGYLDSSALAVLHRVWLHSHGADCGGIRVVVPDGSFGRRVLAITKLDDVFILAPSVEEAVVSLADARRRA